MLTRRVRTIPRVMLLKHDSACFRFSLLIYNFDSIWSFFFK